MDFVDFHKTVNLEPLKLRLSLQVDVENEFKC